VTPFHLAFPVDDLERARHFYARVLGCPIGREHAGHWIDFNLFGHQLTAHIGKAGDADNAPGSVDGDAVPIPHFGVILDPQAWHTLAARLEADPDTHWVRRPKTRFAGTEGEQSTFFVLDPAGNALEFKAFADMAGIFAGEGR